MDNSPDVSLRKTSHWKILSRIFVKRILRLYSGSALRLNAPPSNGWLYDRCRSPTDKFFLGRKPFGFQSVEIRSDQRDAGETSGAVPSGFSSPQPRPGGPSQSGGRALRQFRKTCYAEKKPKFRIFIGSIQSFLDSISQYDKAI